VKCYAGCRKEDAGAAACLLSCESDAGTTSTMEFDSLATCDKTNCAAAGDAGGGD
jgi:hypothetical protein